MGPLLASHPRLQPIFSSKPGPYKRLLEAMVQAVADKGYDSATVSDAVKLARVSRGTFYELFESKEQCLLEAYKVGCEVLEARIDEAIRDAGDWREEIRLGIRAYLHALEDDPVFARVFLLEAQVAGAERERVHRGFAERYAKTFARSGRPVPPADALYLLSVGVHELSCARVRRDEGVLDLEDTLVGCAVRLAAKEEPWT